MIKKILFFLIITLFNNQSYAEEDLMIMKLKDGDVIEHRWSAGPILPVSLIDLVENTVLDTCKSTSLVTQ